MPKNKKEELNQNIADQYPQQEQITNNAKKLKTEIANALSKQFNGRIVNIYAPL